MNLYDDESLKQEVIYLHSLWYQGPPTRNPIPSLHFNPFQDPIQRSRPNYIPPADLQLLSRYSAVVPQINSRDPNYSQNLYNNKRPRPDSGREWPVKELINSPSTGSGWPESKPCKKARPVPAEERAKFAANMLQRDIHRTCREFFGRKSGEEDSSVAGGDGSDSDEGDEDQGSEKDGFSSKEFQFLSRLFEENGKLKEYYEKNTGNGEFWCLVCGGTGEKSSRKFKSCLALVQHSLAIHKTDLKTQHRALAQVVCNVLGWDVDNPVASSQKEPQTLGVEAVAEGAIELPSDPKKPEVMSVEEPAKTAVLHMQRNASEALNNLFAKDTAGAVDGIEEDGGDENLSEELELISRLFSENVELKSYYEKNHEGGDFICLVCCAATDKKMMKRFKHCHGLVQHSTKKPAMKIRAHKAFARFVCELLGWEFDRLSCRVVKGSGPLVESRANQNNEKPSSMIEDMQTQSVTD